MVWLCRLAVLIGALLIGASLAEAQQVHAQLFRDAAARRMDGRTMGWAFAIANADRVVASASGGWAWAPGDGGIQFTAATLSNIGSISKVPSGVALLDILEERGGVAAGLRTRLIDYVPRRWIPAYFGGEQGEALSSITLRDLLAHRSGIPPEPSTGGVHGTRIARALAGYSEEGAEELANNRFRYNNNNYTLLLYVIPAIVFREAVVDFERRNEDVPLAQYNGSAAAEFGALYELWMRNFVLARHRMPGALATCRPAERARFAYAKEYSSAHDDRGQTQNAEFCRSQGSWFMSTIELAKFAAAVEFSDVFIEPETLRLMQPDNLGGMLVYWRTWSESRLPGRMTGHGGTSPLGARAALVRLPFGHVGVALSNSSDLSSIALGDVLIDTFWEATREVDEWNSDRPGSNIAAFDLPQFDAGLCRAACDARSDCRAWTYVKPGVQAAAARCWLKAPAPDRTTSTCCISGVK